MKKLFLFLLLGICCCSLTSCKKAQFNEKEGVITIGLECNYAPFNWAETKPTATNVKVTGASNMYAEGYDVMIAKRIAEQLGYELKIKAIDWNGLVPALTSGDIDLIIAGMSPTAERKKVINFTNEYYRSNHVLLMKKSSVYANAKTFDDLNNAKVIGQKSTSYDELAKQIAEKNSSTIYQNPLNTIPEIIISLTSNASDITVLEEPVARGIVAKYPEFTYIQLESAFDILEENLIVSIGVRKIDEALLAAVNNALANISQEERNNIMQTAIGLQNEE